MQAHSLQLRGKWWPYTVVMYVLPTTIPGNMLCLWELLCWGSCSSQILQRMFCCGVSLTSWLVNTMFQLNSKRLQERWRKGQPNSVSLWVWGHLTATDLLTRLVPSRMSQGKDVQFPQGLQISLCWTSNWNNPSQSLNVRAVEERSHATKYAICP